MTGFSGLVFTSATGARLQLMPSARSSSPTNSPSILRAFASGTGSRAVGSPPDAAKAIAPG